MRTLVPYLPGDGTIVFLYVAYLAEFPRAPDKHGSCAFCLGDPCAERGGDTRIARYYQRNPKAETCPMCDGRPS